MVSDAIDWLARAAFENLPESCRGHRVDFLGYR
jgi:hypothetical protein